MARAGSARRRSTRPAAPKVFTLAGLNPPQREAVLHDTGPILVLAGAGSGKTRVITYRMARMICEGVSPERILGVTFTNKAAKEMRQRLVSVVGSEATGVQLSTFHSLGLSILKEEHEAAGLQKSFGIYDTGDQISLVRELMRQVKVADRRLDAAKILDHILKAKRNRLAEVPIDYADDYELAAYELYPRYISQMRAFNAVDFDDLLLRALDVLQVDDVRERWADKFDYLMVDEYQDTSADQLDMLKALAGTKRNVCVVGDDDQAIYGWRGAAADNILRFSQEFGQAKEVILDQNYRSTGNILSVANSVIVNNAVRKSKSLWSADGPGEPVEQVACADGEDEAQFVAETVHKLVYGGVSYEDIAVLYRSNAQSRIFEEIMALERIPFRVVGGQAFYERKEVRDVMAYLALANNLRDETALRRIVNVPARGIGPTSLERLAAYAAEQGGGLFGALENAGSVAGLPRSAVVGAEAFVGIMAPVAQQLRNAKLGQLTPVVKRLLDVLRLREAITAADDAPTVSARRLENLDEVINSLHRFETTTSASDTPLADFLHASSLVREDTKDEENTGSVTLMTLHSAKGLEFPYVFMVGMEEEILPHRRTLELGGELSEERRLCYVGMTRAKKQLWLVWASGRMMRGKRAERGQSRFLLEVPDGDAIRRWERGAPPTEEDNDATANAFFEKMRAQLGIEE